MRHQAVLQHGQNGVGGLAAFFGRVDLRGAVMRGAKDGKVQKKQRPRQLLEVLERELKDWRSRVPASSRSRAYERRLAAVFKGGKTRRCA